MFYKINNNFFLDEEDIGKLVCVRIHQHYYNCIDVYDNSLIINFTYKTSNIRPNTIVLLKDTGSILFLKLNYDSKIEIKFLTEYKNIVRNKNKLVEKYKNFYKKVK